MVFTTNIDLASKTIQPLPEDQTDEQQENNNPTFGKYKRLFTNGYEAFLSGFGAVQNLANPKVKYVNIPNGWRKEQVAAAFSRYLKWNAQERALFDQEGYYYPGTYLISSDKKAADIKTLMLERFTENVSSKYPTSTAEKIPLDMALKVASLIEREAADKNDMRLISGVIWNRYFLGMPLGIDATLQYARGGGGNGWWPRVRPADKNIKSPYNTYKNIGLPPTPIANPGLASIQAALNPKKINCLYYLHDKDGNFHCTKSYREHQENIKKYY